jgi:mitochondrial chaperone BCS1
LEDIDAAGISRLKSETDNSKKSIGLQKLQEILTLFGLLDNLDGVSSPEDRVVMMTTNYAKRLDEAPIRPGRIDRRIQFELADEDVIRQLFSFAYEQPGDGEGAIGSPTIKAQSTQFAKSVPPSAFSQAELLSNLIQYKDQPNEALRDC